MNRVRYLGLLWGFLTLAPVAVVDLPADENPLHIEDRSWCAALLLEPKSFDFNNDGESDFRVSVLKASDGKKIFLESKNEESGVGFMAFYVQGKLALAYADTDGDGVYEKLIVYNNNEEPVAAYKKVQQGVLVAIPRNEIKDIWPVALE